MTSKTAQANQIAPVATEVKLANHLPAAAANQMLVCVMFSQDHVRITCCFDFLTVQNNDMYMFCHELTSSSQLVTSTIASYFCFVVKVSEGTRKRRELNATSIEQGIEREPEVRPPPYSAVPEQQCKCWVFPLNKIIVTSVTTRAWEFPLA